MLASPVALVGKNPTANEGEIRDAGLIPRFGKSPERGHKQSIPVFLPVESRVQRSLAGYNPQGHKESDMETTEGT